MTVLILLTTAGAATGPFDLYSDIDGYLVPFETGVAKASLTTPPGYSTALVPNGTTIIRVKSTGSCTNYIDIVIDATTTTTTTASPTTTSTTTVGTYCVQVELFDTTYELACPAPPSNLYDIFRTYKATLLTGPGGTPVLAPMNIAVQIPTSGDFGPGYVNIIIPAGSSSATDGLYTRVYPDCDDRSQILLQTVNLAGATTNQYSICPLV